MPKVSTVSYKVIFNSSSSHPLENAVWWLLVCSLTLISTHGHKQQWQNNIIVFQRQHNNLCTVETHVITYKVSSIPRYRLCFTPFHHVMGYVIICYLFLTYLFLKYLNFNTEPNTSIHPNITTTVTSPHYGVDNLCLCFYFTTFVSHCVACNTHILYDGIHHPLKKAGWSIKNESDCGM